MQVTQQLLGTQFVLEEMTIGLKLKWWDEWRAFLSGHGGKMLVRLWVKGYESLSSDKGVEWRCLHVKKVGTEFVEMVSMHA